MRWILLVKIKWTQMVQKMQTYGAKNLPDGMSNFVGQPTRTQGVQESIATQYGHSYGDNAIFYKGKYVKDKKELTTLL